MLTGDQLPSQAQLAKMFDQNGKMFGMPSCLVGDLPTAGQLPIGMTYSNGAMQGTDANANALGPYQDA